MGLLLPGATKHKEERKKRPIIKQIGKNNDSRLGLCSAGSNWRLIDFEFYRVWKMSKVFLKNSRSNSTKLELNSKRFRVFKIKLDTFQTLSNLES